MGTKNAPQGGGKQTFGHRGQDRKSGKLAGSSKKKGIRGGRKKIVLGDAVLLRGGWISVAAEDSYRKGSILKNGENSYSSWEHLKRCRVRNSGKTQI